MANSIIRYPLPILGLNTVNPYVEHDSGYARELTNYSIKDGRLFTRPGVESHAFNTNVVNTAIGVPPLLWFDPTSGDNQSITDDGSRIAYNTYAGVRAEPAGTFARHYHCTRLKFSGTATTLDMVFGIRRTTVIPPTTPFQPLLATSPFTAIGPTANFGIVYHATAHKGRLYYYNGAYTVEWGNVGQVAGVFPVANTISFEQFLAGQGISRMFSVSLSPGTAPSQNVFVIFGTGGRVLVFEGDTPTSANWNLIASHDMPPPIGALGFVEIDGDIFVATKKYCYWFRDLFNGGARSAYEASPSMPIENLYQDVFWDGSYALPESAQAYYEPVTDAIVVQCSEKGSAGLTNFEYQNEGICFAYFRKYKAWALWAATPFFAPVINSGDILYATAYRSVINKLNPSTPTVDSWVYNNGGTNELSTIGIETSWKTPFASIAAGVGLNLKSARAWVQCKKSNLIYEIAVDIYKTRAIFDYSDANAPYSFYTQSMVTQVNPQKYTESKINLPLPGAAVYDTYYSPLLQLGGDGGELSLQITFKGATNGNSYSIYKLAALVEQGSEIF